jgi:hypothetical protein
VLGIDVARRVGNAMFHHYDRAGTSPVPLARWRCRRARLLKARRRQTAMALGDAAQPMACASSWHHDQASFNRRRRASKPARCPPAGRPGHARPLALEAARHDADGVSTKNDWLEITEELGKALKSPSTAKKPCLRCIDPPQHRRLRSWAAGA